MRPIRSAVATLALALASCGPTVAVAQAVRTVAITPVTDTLVVGDTVTISAVPLGASGKKVSAALTFSTAAPTRVSLTRQATGKARAIARDTGLAPVYATASGTTGRALLLIRPRLPAPGPKPIPVDTTTSGSGGTGGTTPPPADTAPAPVPTPDDSADGARRPALPREWTPPAVVPLRRYRVADEAQLQAALDTARAGDELRLAPGRVYVGWWTVRRAIAGGFVTVTTDLPDSLLPPSGTVPTPAQIARFAVLATSGKNEPALRVGPGARGWRFVGVKFDALPTVTALNTLVFVGAADGNTRVTDVHPQELLFDRVALTPHDSLDTVRGLLLNAARVAVLASRIFVHGASSDALAVGCWTVCRELVIAGNSITGNGHHLIVGGADPADSTLLPRDLVIRGNRFWRPESWRGVWPVKTCLELKLGERVLIEGNVFEGHWADAQSGFCLLFKSVNQYGGAPWSQTRDVTVRWNIVRNSASAFNIAAAPEPHPALPLARLRLEGNLVYDLDGRRTTGGVNGRVIQLNGLLRDVAIVGNTLLAAPDGYSNSGLDLGVNAPQKATGIAFRRNVLSLGEYAVQSSLGVGTTAFAALAGTSWRADGNVFVQGANSQKPELYPPGSRFLDGFSALGLALGAEPAGYAFPAASPFAGVGADIAAVLQATAGARAMR